MTAERITTPAERDALPYGSVVRSDAGTIACRYNAQHGVVFGDDRPFPWAKLRLPAVLLHIPGRDLIAEAEARGARAALLSAAEDVRWARTEHRHVRDWLRARAEQTGGDRG